jgi:hypothetical protein
MDVTIQQTDRNYTSRADVEQAFRAGRDFIIMGSDDASMRANSGRRMSIRDLKEGDTVTIRYSRGYMGCEKFHLVTV